MRVAPSLCWEMFKRVEAGFIRVSLIQRRSLKRQRDQKSQIGTSARHMLEEAEIRCLNVNEIDIQEFLDRYFVTETRVVSLCSLIECVVKQRCNKTLTFLIAAVRVRIASNTFICPKSTYTRAFKMGFQGTGATVQMDMHYLLIKAVEKLDVLGFYIYLNDPRTKIHSILLKTIHSNEKDLFTWIMRESRVDPSHKNYEIVRLSIQLQRQFHIDILLKDPRVQPFLERADKLKNLVSLGKVLTCFAK